MSRAILDTSIVIASGDDAALLGALAEDARRRHGVADGPGATFGVPIAMPQFMHDFAKWCLVPPRRPKISPQRGQPFGLDSRGRGISLDLVLRGHDAIA